MQKITPFLWFDDKAEEAARFYVSIFNNSKMVSVIRYGDEGPGPKGSVMTAAFQLDGQEFMALNGGPKYRATPATSFVIECQTQEEIDHYWEKLGEGGRYDQCGWLDDKFGFSWQVVPAVLHQLMADPVKAPRVIDSFMKMSKFDIKTLMDA